MSNYQSKRNNAPEFNVAEESRVFTLWIDSPEAQKDLKSVLPDNVAPEVFIRTAKQAVLSSPTLLNPKWRDSLLQAIAKAAAQGLPPDGKHGALVPREQKGGGYGISWQPMVWGILKLGRQVKSVGKIKASLVFYDEPFRFVSGDEDRIEHEEIPEIRNAAYESMWQARENERGEMEGGLNINTFMEKVQGAYCIIKPCDGGESTKRFMPRGRIDRVRAVSKANNGPWSGPFVDEMMLKTVILYTMKWVDTSNDSPEMRRLREALETDTEIDFEDNKPSIEGKAEQQSRTQAMIASEQRVVGLEELMAKLVDLDKQMVAVGNDEPVEPEAKPAQAPKQAEPANDKPSGSAPAQEQPSEPAKKPRKFLDWMAEEVEPRFAKYETVDQIEAAVSDMKDSYAKLSEKQRERFDEMVSSNRARVKRPDPGEAVADGLAADIDEQDGNAALDSFLALDTTARRRAKLNEEQNKRVDAAVEAARHSFKEAG